MQYVIIILYYASPIVGRTVTANESFRPLHRGGFAVIPEILSAEEVQRYTNLSNSLSNSVFQGAQRKFSRIKR